MKLQKQSVINADRQRVWRLFDDPGTMRRWQPNLRSQTLVSGADRRPGAVYELVYDNNGKLLHMTSTIVSVQEPERLILRNDSVWSSETVEARFESLPDGRTRWTFILEIEWKGWFRVAALFLGRVMRIRLETEMRRFRDFVERESRSL